MRLHHLSCYMQCGLGTFALGGYDLLLPDPLTVMSGLVGRA